MSTVGIMDEPCVTTVDVRQMLCAQALAVVAQALARAPIGETLRVLYSTADVEADLLVWAAERRQSAETGGSSMLWITRRA